MKAMNTNNQDNNEPVTPSLDTPTVKEEDKQKEVDKQKEEKPKESEDKLKIEKPKEDEDRQKDEDNQKQEKPKEDRQKEDKQIEDNQKEDKPKEDEQKENKQEEDKQKESKQKEKPVIEQQVKAKKIRDVKMTKIGDIITIIGKEFDKSKAAEGDDAFVDPTKSLPKNPSKLSVFHSSQDVETNIKKWEEKRLMLLSCQSQDISVSTAYQLIENPRFLSYDKRFLSFDGSNATRDDIHLDMFLDHQIGRGEKLIVFIDIERQYSFFDSLFVGKMTAQSIKEKFQQKDILLIGIPDPQLMEQAREQIEQKFCFADWKIDFLPHLLKNYFPEKSQRIMEEILDQKEKGLWGEGNGGLVYDLVYRYMREGILEEEINKRKKLEPSKMKVAKFERNDTFVGEIKEVKARELFVDKEPHKTVLYAGTFFSKLTPLDFDRLVRLLLKEKTIEIEKSTEVVTGDGVVKTVKTREKKQVEELWDKEADNILKECHLQAVRADAAAQQVDFSYPYLRSDLKNLIEKEHPMYLRQQFQPIQDSGILFASNVSAGITENIIRLAVYMIILNPGYYGGEWLKEFIYQVKEQYNLQYESTANPLEVIIQFIENNENKIIRRHFYMQISRLIREMLNHPQLKDVVKSFLNDLFSSEGQDAVLHIALNVGTGLLSTPHFDFDLFYWLRRLMDQGPEDIKEETYESLHQIASERSSHIYDILEAIRTWLPEKDKEPDALSPSNRYALLFIVDYTSGTLYQFKKKYKEKFYGQGLSTYPLFMPLKKNKSSREKRLKNIIEWLLHPLTEGVFRARNQGNDLSPFPFDFDINAYTAALLEEWTLALLGREYEKADPQAKEILDILLRQITISLNRDRPRLRKIMDWFAKRRINYRDLVDEFDGEKSEIKKWLMAGYQAARMLASRLKQLMAEDETGGKK
jgi:hypothetical protein